MKRKNLWIGLGLALVLAVFAACGSDRGGGDGTLKVSLTDATLPGFQAIYVTIDEVQAHRTEDQGWVTVGAPHATVDLLKLINGVRMNLGVADLAPGSYTQLRLILGRQPSTGLNLHGQPHAYANYVIDASGTVVELKIPSGMQTGIKLVHGFEINENQTTELLLDFDAMGSVVKAGASGQWLLKPTIKVLDTVEAAIVSGAVHDSVGIGIAGVLVSAQRVDLTATDEKDEVTVAAATFTDADGHYKLFLAPGDYNLVVFASSGAGAFGPVCSSVSLIPAAFASFDLTPQFTDLVGTLDGTVTIANAATDQHATLSVRHEILCDATPQPVELVALNIASGGGYNVELPAGNYRTVAWTFDRPTQAGDATVNAGVITTADFGF